MKKRILAILACVLMTLICGIFTSCRDITNSFIEDGDFKYYYIKAEDCYAIVGTTEQGFKKTVYVPTHFRGKEVRYTCVVRTNFSGATVYTLEVKNCDRLYFSYLHKSSSSSYYGDAKIPFCVNSSDSRSAWSIICSNKIGIGYVSVPLYNKIKKYYNQFSDVLVDITEVGNYIWTKRLDLGEQNYYENSMIKANLSFIFNFSDAPNDGYFFINNFEYGSLVETTPYEPLREGYTFEGWYKEPECLNKWNFEADKLPEAEYDENGILIFQETKLYAKWTKQ